MKVSDMMQRRVVTARVDEAAEKVWRRMVKKKIRHIVVVQAGRVVGVVSDRDMAGARGPGIREGRTARQMMTPGVLAATSDMTVQEAAGLLRNHCVSCLPVIEDGKLRGIVTTSDILDYVIGGGAGGAGAQGTKSDCRRAARRAPSPIGC